LSNSARFALRQTQASVELSATPKATLSLRSDSHESGSRSPFSHSTGRDRCLKLSKGS
jgi:hypothetical protein